MKYAIEVREVNKNYGCHKILKGLNFQIVKGEIFALLGVNGAGKTTTLECIEGLRKYDGGSIVVNPPNGELNGRHLLCPLILNLWKR